MVTATNNASMRRHSPSVEAEDTRRFLEDPNTKRVLGSMREELVRTIETTPSDGSQGSDEYQLEVNRMLRTLARMRSGMSVKTQLEDLRAAAFKSTPPPPEDDNGV